MDAVLAFLEKGLFLRSVGDLEAVLELSVLEKCPRSRKSYTTRSTSPDACSCV